MGVRLMKAKEMKEKRERKRREEEEEETRKRKRREEEEQAVRAREEKERRLQAELEAKEAAEAAAIVEMLSNPKLLREHVRGYIERGMRVEEWYLDIGEYGPKEIYV